VTHSVSYFDELDNYCILFYEQKTIWCYGIDIFLKSQISVVKVANMSNAYTGGPRYMRSFYLWFRIYAIQKWPFFWNLSSNYQSSLVFLYANSLYASLFLGFWQTSIDFLFKLCIDDNDTTSPLKNIINFKSGQNWPKNNHLTTFKSGYVQIRD